jgi:flagellar protein FliJ
MKTDKNERLRQIKEFEVNQDRCRVTQIEAMISDLGRICLDLENQIGAEEARSHIHDPKHFAYSTYASAARERLANLARTLDALAIERDRLVGMMHDTENWEHAA